MAVFIITMCIFCGTSITNLERGNLPVCDKCDDGSGTCSGL
jgi:hypothetical protein